MGICKKIIRKDLKWWQLLWNYITGNSEKNYTYIEINKSKKKESDK